MNDPTTRDEWQEAMNAAHAVVVLEAVRRLGLIEGGPQIDLARCADILGRANALGLVADPFAAHELLNQVGAGAAIHRVFAAADEFADGGIIAAAFIGTPLQDYAINDLWRGDGRDA